MRAWSATDIELIYRLMEVRRYERSEDCGAYLKLAVSIHSQPSFTTHRTSSIGVLAARLNPPSCGPGAGSVVFGSAADVHGMVRSGSKYPLSLRTFREVWEETGRDLPGKLFETNGKKESERHNHEDLAAR